LVSRALIAATGALVLGACSSSSSSTSSKSAGASGSSTPAATGTSTPATAHAIKQVSITYVDRHRPTAAWKQAPGKPFRTLVTTIVYPADRNGAPFPLIAFSHGFGAGPRDYISLLNYWASEGFVVAAPTFPLTNTATPGGADENDLSNQPGDISFVITSVLSASASRGNPLSGLVNPNEVGAAGHSNGAITTLGLVANTCCFDSRIKAAEVLAGTQSATFDGGHYDFSRIPPILFVHGSDDEVIPYDDGVTAYNDAHGPKALLTVIGGDHGSAAGSAAPSGASVRATTTDFFRGYLLHDTAALVRLASDAKPGATTLHDALTAGSTATVTTVPPPKLELRATVTPQHSLHSGQTVTATWSGYQAGKTVNVLECAHSPTSPLSESSCGFTNGALLHADPTGSGTVTVKIVTGKVGDGTCDATNPCQIVVNNAGSVDPKSSVRLPITFAA
jgi:predicted dienelactone hydrolase